MEVIDVAPFRGKQPKPGVGFLKVGFEPGTWLRHFHALLEPRLPR